MRGHDRFEALAGAVMLGEATPPERAEFDLHASACAACRADVGYGDEAARRIAHARDEETWRPTIGAPLLERVSKTRAKRDRRTVGAFGWAIALSLVVNVAFVSGMSGNWLSAFHRTGEGRSDVASQLVTLERAPRVAPLAAVPVARTVTAYVPRRHRRKPLATSLAHATLAIARHPAGVPATRDDAEALPSDSDAANLIRDAEKTALAPDRGFPDVLAGLATPAARRVAVGALDCEGRRNREAAGATAEPCTAPVATPLER